MNIEFDLNAILEVSEDPDDPPEVFDFIRIRGFDLPDPNIDSDGKPYTP